MATKTVPTLLEDIRLLGNGQYEIVQAVRALININFKSVEEDVKYGGILFTSGVIFCGVFAYKAHVTVEFGSGAQITDPFGHLEGTGKGRRHLKLYSMSDIIEKKLAEYLLLALKAAAGDE